jgi:hypothetical protein
MAHSRFATTDYFKKCIRRVVAEYKLLYPTEYKLTVEAVEMKRKTLKDPKFATIEASRLRALFEVSETLAEMLIRDLDLQTTEWFKGLEGARWFAKTYREFCIPDQI